LGSTRPEFGSHQTSRREPWAVHDLDVIARYSTAVYEGKPAHIRQIGKDLSAGYVLDAAPGRQRWTCLTVAASSRCKGDWNSFIEQIGVDLNVWICRADRLEKIL
jgi:hypothetical protein